MNCLSEQSGGSDVLIAYVEGKLEPQQVAELEVHFAECSECRGLVNAWQALDGLPAPEVSPDFDAKLYARIAKEHREPFWKRFLWKPVLPVTAGCAVLALALLIQGPDAGVAPVSDPEIKAKAETVNIEQVEQALEDLELLVPVKGTSEL